MIHVLCGMIASGKSTYAQKAAQQQWLILNDDAIVSLLHGNCYWLYDKKLKVLYKSVENHIVATVLAMGKSLVVDRGLNVSVAGRQRWVALAKSFDVPCAAIVFPNEGPEIHAKRRSEADARGHPYDYWLEVAQVHNSQWVEPSPTEGFSRIQRMSYAEIQGAIL